MAGRVGATASELADVAAKASTAYDAFSVIMGTLLQFGSLEEVKSFNEGMHILHRLIHVDKEYQAKMGGGEFKPLQRSQRFGRGGASYSVKQIFEYMSLGVHVRNQRRLSYVIEAAYHVTCGDFQDYLISVSSDGIRRDRGVAESAPSAPTLSRARYRLDAFLMLIRREQWRNLLQAALAAAEQSQWAAPAAIISIGQGPQHLGRDITSGCGLALAMPTLVPVVKSIRRALLGAMGSHAAAQKECFCGAKARAFFRTFVWMTSLHQDSPESMKLIARLESAFTMTLSILSENKEPAENEEEMMSVVCLTDCPDDKRPDTWTALVLDHGGQKLVEDVEKLTQPPFVWRHPFLQKVSKLIKAEDLVPHHQDLGDAVDWISETFLAHAGRGVGLNPEEEAFCLVSSYHALMTDCFVQLTHAQLFKPDL